ncbi:cytochrome c-type biogenesis CcmF C-terminal domain-containing protein, partial [Acinetobacter baumannii]
SVGGYVYHFKEVNKIAGPNYISMQAIFDVTKDEKSVTTLIPEKRFFTVQEMPMTEAAIDRGFTRDLYIALGEQLGESTW